MAFSVVIPRVIDRKTLTVWLSLLLFVSTISIIVLYQSVEQTPIYKEKPTSIPVSMKVYKTKEWNPNLNHINPKTFIRSLVNVAKNVRSASIHAKSLKTISALKIATGELQKVLQQLQINYRNITKRSGVQSRTICPEEFRGANYGRPLYEKGFGIIPCDYGRPLSELVTMVIVVGQFTKTVNDIVIATQALIPGVRTIVGVENLEKSQVGNALLAYISYNADATEGQIWNSLLENVKTEYVLIARDIQYFDKNMRIERLIRVIETDGFLAAGGATRSVQDGSWKIGCYQNGMRNYSAAYYEGYDESVNECVVCDYIDGPFVTGTNRLRELPFDDTIRGEGVFHDLFLRLGTEKSVVCPDSMFHVKSRILQSKSESWESFARKWELYKIKFVPGPEIIMGCPLKSKEACSFPKNSLVSPCCIADILTMVRHVMGICERNGIFCELGSGTLLGAVKLEAILPWDIDADIGFLLSNFSVMRSHLRDLSLPDHFGHVDLLPHYDYNDTILSASFKLQSNISYWKVDIWGQMELTSQKYLTGSGLKGILQNGSTVKTKVKVKGVALNGAFNPGLCVRNRYGLDIYRHAQHWRNLGKLTSVEQYATASFLECPEPGHHACLDGYSNDGNLQFSDPIP